MALNGLVTKNMADYVRTWRLVGQWKESGSEEFARGRVPDSSMMLAIALRAALDRMKRLESFSWELNINPLQTIYHGLATRPSLASLTIQFPEIRVARPLVVIPPMPNLRALTVTNIDPLCYPDDISLLLLHSRKLEDLKLHWSPRMRDMGEPSINLQSYFGRCMAANYRLQTKRVGMKNLYTRNNAEIEQAFDTNSLEEWTFIKCINPADSATVFLDETWMTFDKAPTALKVLRLDGLNRVHVAMLAGIAGLEEFYLISARFTSSSLPTSTGTTPVSVSPSSSSALTPSSMVSQPDALNLASEYIAVLTVKHGKSLRCLLLSDQWMLGKEAVIRLLQACPNLEQLGIALEDIELKFLRLLLSLSPKLSAIRILVNPAEPVWEKLRGINDSIHAQAMSYELWRDEYRGIKWVGLGGSVFECGGVVAVDENQNGQPIYRRVVRPVTWDAVKHVGIWVKDNLEL